MLWRVTSMQSPDDEVVRPAGYPDDVVMGLQPPYGLLDPLVPLLAPQDLLYLPYVHPLWVPPEQEIDLLGVIVHACRCRGPPCHPITSRDMQKTMHRVVATAHRKMIDIWSRFMRSSSSSSSWTLSSSYPTLRVRKSRRFFSGKQVIIPPPRSTI